MKQKPKSPEDIKKIIKQLEGVYKTTKDEKQKKRVGSQLVKLKRNLDSPNIDSELLQTPQSEKLSSQEEPKGDIENSNLIEEAEDSNPLLSYPSLCELIIAPIHSRAKNFDVNFFATILTEFEDEFWPALSEYHLKLDYNHSKKRDAFFDKLEISKITLKELLKVFDQLDHSVNTSHEEQLEVMRKKQEREFIMKMVDFLSELRKFLNIILTNHDEGGNIIVEPEDIIKFDKLYGEKKLSNKTVIVAMRTIFQFVTEALEASGFSNFYKKGE